jgi:hypothetical protein
MNSKEIKDFDQEIKKDEKEYLDENAEFELEDIGMVLDYFSGPFFKDSLGNSVKKLSTHVKNRILMVLDKVESRLKALTRPRRQQPVTKMKPEEQQRRLNILRVKVEFIREE